LKRIRKKPTQSQFQPAAPAKTAPRPHCLVDKPGGPESICVRGWENPHELLDFAVKTACRHYCVGDRMDIHHEIRVSEVMIQRPKEFLDDPVAVVLGSNNGKPLERGNQWSRSFEAIREKDLFLTELQGWLSPWMRSTSAQSDFLLMADELMTNALFNAPFVDKVTYENPGIDRTNREVKMSDGKQGQLMVGKDSDRVVIACRDPFGSLNLERDLNKLLKCESDGFASNINITGKGGVGVGNCLIFNLCSSLYIGVEAGASTVVAASFFWNWSGKRRAQSQKGLHFFEIGR